MASLSAFNRWLEEDWGFDHEGRIIAAPMLSLADPDAAVAEVDSLLERGARIVHVRPAPVPGANGTSRSLGDKLARSGVGAARRGGVPVAFHLGDSGYNAVRRRVGRAAPSFGLRQQRPLEPGARRPTARSTTPSPRWSSHGVFTRHPTLRVASIENGSDWVRAAGQAADEAGQPDAVGLPRGPARHDPPPRVGHAVLRGGPAQRSPTSSASSASCSAPTGRTARAWPQPLDFVKELDGFDRRAIRRIMRDNCLELLGTGGVVTGDERRAGPTTTSSATRSRPGSTSTGIPTSRSTSGGASSPRPAGPRRTSPSSRAAAGCTALAGRSVRAALRGVRGAAPAGRARPAHGRADDPDARHRRSRSRATSRRSSTGSVGWCQLFSEPGAGSDLAGLTTPGRARRRPLGHHRAEGVEQHGDARPTTGCCSPAPTSTSPKHTGISWFAFPLDQPGVTIRPLREMTGDAVFNEVFLDDAVVRRRRPHRRRGQRLGGHPDDALLRAHRHRRRRRARRLPRARSEGRHARPAGRRRARVDPTPGGNMVLDYRRPGRAGARRTGAPTTRMIRQKLARLVHRTRSSGSWNAQRGKAEASQGRRRGGRQHRQARADADREAVGRSSALDILGAGRHARGPPTDSRAAGSPRRCVFSPASSIYGGTDEIQRNIVAERTLGLPKS